MVNVSIQFLSEEDISTLLDLGASPYNSTVTEDVQVAGPLPGFLKGGGGST